MYEETRVDTYVSIIYFASAMKDFAETFDIPRHLLWGSGQDKQTVTNLRWEQLPHYHRIVSEIREAVSKEMWSVPDVYSKNMGQLVNLKHDIERVTLERSPKGYMTIRQFLQEIGEKMFLDLDPLYWIRRFESEARANMSMQDVVITPDPRKPNQIDSIQSLGGVVFRFTRDPNNGADKHIAECALDEPAFSWKRFDEVVDNQSLTIEQTHREVVERLMVRGIISREVNLSHVDWNPQ
jgi:hypothetical protein